jgi:hypothetical protein
MNRSGGRCLGGSTEIGAAGRPRINPAAGGKTLIVFTVALFFQPFSGAALRMRPAGAAASTPLRWNWPPREGIIEVDSRLPTIDD